MLLVVIKIIQPFRISVTVFKSNTSFNDKVQIAEYRCMCIYIYYLKLSILFNCAIPCAMFFIIFIVNSLKIPLLRQLSNSNPCDTSVYALLLFILPHVSFIISLMVFLMLGEHICIKDISIKYRSVLFINVF